MLGAQANWIAVVEVPCAAASRVAARFVARLPAAELETALKLAYVIRLTQFKGGRSSSIEHLLDEVDHIGRRARCSP